MTKNYLVFAMLAIFTLASCDDDYAIFRKEDVSFYLDGKKWKAESIYKTGTVTSNDTLYITATKDNEELELEISFDHSAINFTDKSGNVYKSIYNNTDQLLKLEIDEYKNDWLDGDFDCKLFTEDGKKKINLYDGEYEVNLE